MVRPALILLLVAFVHATGATPRGIVTEGVPPVPETLRAELAPYLDLGGASFRGWHPERREVMLTSRIGDVTHLHLMAQPNGKRVGLTNGPTAVQNGWIQPGGEHLLYSADHRGNENFQLYLRDIDGPQTPTFRLTDGRSRNTDPVWSKDGRQIAYASNQRNGKNSDLVVTGTEEPRSERRPLGDKHPGWAPVEWASDGRRILVREFIGTTEVRLAFADCIEGKLTPITRPEDRHYIAHPVLAEYDQAIYCLSDHESDTLKPTRIDIRTGEITKLRGAPDWDAEELTISSDGRRLAVSFNIEGFSEVRLWELPSGKPLPSITLPRGVFSNLTFRPGSHELGFTLNSEESANDVWSADLETGALTRWTNRIKKPAKEIPVIQPVVQRVVSFDQLSIPFLVYYPDATKFPGRRPALLVMHGGPEGQSRPGYRGSYYYYLNELGVALVYPNVRGSTGYGRHYLSLDNGLKREDSVRDVGAVLDWISRSDRLDAGRVGVLGASYGGYMSLACLIRYPDRLRCGVDSVGISNFVTFLEDTSDYRRGNRRLEYGDERKPEVRQFLESISPVNRAGDIRAPLLIIQGRNDPRVPYTEAERMRDALRLRGGTVWYVLAQDEGHGFSKKSNVDFQNLVTAHFLREHLLK